MTREEAIETIKTAIAEVEWEYPMNYAAAFEVAIEALEQKPILDILDKIRAEITDWQNDIHDNEYDAEKHDFVFERIFEIIDEYRESEE